MLLKLFREVPSTGKPSLLLLLIVESGWCALHPLVFLGLAPASGRLCLMTDCQHMEGLGPCHSLPAEAKDRELLNMGG